jgi:LDH2 family malate/lactate/ureidoglycolate dehydrogenase
MTKVNVHAEELREFCSAVLNKCIPNREADIVAHSLVDADLCGVGSHGVSRLTDYLKRLEAGLVKRETNITLIRETTTTALLDADNGWGQVASVQAMDTAITKALEHGTGFVGVRNSNHNGTAAYYTRIAAERGCIGIATTNTSALMVPFGAMEPSLGTNPISISVPAGPGKDPVVLDMATSNVARGKIILASKKGESIPEGWAITKDGEPTTDPIKALQGYILPMGPKGSGLAIIVDILSGVLTGALFGKQIPRMYDDPEPQQIGHFFGAISVEAFMDMPFFSQRMKEKVDETVNSTPMKGFDRVYMPGEIELEKKRQQESNGIQLPIEIYKELERTGLQYGVEIERILQTGIKEAN